MRIVYYVSTGKDREEHLAKAMAEGLAKHGVEFDAIAGSRYHGPRRDTDVVAVCGLKGVSRRCIDHHTEAGKQFILFDKGYFRVKMYVGGRPATTHIRASINAFQPLAYFQREQHDVDRWRRFNMKIHARWPGRGADMVIFAGSSQKYCNFHDLGDATEYAKHVIAQIRHYTDRPIVYRPKPSWRDAVPIPGTRFSRPPERLTDLFNEGSAALVTHGSNAALDAMLGGVPVIVLGDGIAKPLSARLGDLALDELPIPNIRTRDLWCANVAYCQWSYDEIASGEAWDHMLKELR